MTKEEALDTIWMRCQHTDKTFEAYCVLKRELGLNELDGGDRVKPELAKELNELKPCEDAISRQAVLDALDKSKYSNEFCEEHHIDWSINLGMAHIVVNELKPVTPAEKVGHWFVDERPESNREIICSNCEQPVFKFHKLDFDYRPNYCPNCGAKMDDDELELVEPLESKPTNCSTCILDNTDACTRGAGRAVDDEACEDYLASPTGAESEDKDEE